jgi:hypothetical protein
MPGAGLRAIHVLEREAVVKRILLGYLAATMLSAIPAWAQRAPGIVDGDHWMNSPV